MLNSTRVAILSTLLVTVACGSDKKPEERAQKDSKKSSKKYAMKKAANRPMRRTDVEVAQSAGMLGTARAMASKSTDTRNKGDLESLIRKGGGPGICAVVSDDRVEIFKRDAQGRVVKYWAYNERDGAWEPAGSSSFQHNAAGHLKRAASGGGMFWEYTWDENGRMVEMRHDSTKNGRANEGARFTWKGKALGDAPVAGGGVPTWRAKQFPDLPRFVPFTGTVVEAYDKCCSLDGEIGDMDWVKRHRYDKLGRLVEVATILGSTDGTPDRRLIYSYDDQHRLTEERHDPPSIWEGARTRYEWDDKRMTGSISLQEDGKERYRVEYIYADGTDKLIEQKNYQDGAKEPTFHYRLRYECGP